MNSFQHEKTLGAKVSRATYKHVGQVADKKEKNLSNVVRRYVLDGLAREDDLEYTDVMKKIIEQRNLWYDAKEELLYFELENERVSASMMEHTFLDYIDKTLVTLKFKLEPYYTQEKVVERMQEHLETFRERAEYHGVEERLENRIESPYQFVTDKLERSSNAENNEY